MLVIREKFITFLLICQFSNILVGSLRVDPHKQPEPRRIDVMEGDELEIICYPSDEEEDVCHFDEVNLSPSQRNFSSEIEVDSNNRSRIVHKKLSVLSGDSGWYHCSEFDDSIYVSVKPNTSYFVDDILSPMSTLILDNYWRDFETNDNVWISCKPTSPSYDVQVYKDGELFKLMSEKVNQKKDYIRVSDPGIYRCELRNDEGVVATKEYNVTEAHDDFQPTISGKNECYHFNNKTELRVNCTIEYSYLSSRAHDYNRRRIASLEWGISNSLDYNIDYTLNKYYSIQHPIFTNYLILTNELRIHSILDNRTRKFECSAMYTQKSGEKEIHVVVNRPDFQGIKLSTEFSKLSKIIKAVGDDVEFVVAIEAYPDQPDIIWRDPRGREISTVENKKYLIENSCEETKLKVFDLTLEDDGDYRVEARISDLRSNKTLNFNLEIWEKRLIKTLDNVAEYYMQNESARISCITDEAQKLTISWNFRERADSESNSSNNTLKELIIGSDKTTLVWEVQSSGYITCIACEISEDIPGKCDNLTRSIFMTDVPGGFGIISPTREIFTNETVELICAASVYHFTEKVEWLDETDKPLIVTVPGRVNINLTDTNLSYQAILTFNSVRGSDNGTYICSSITDQGQMKRTKYALRVYDPVKPYFIQTNMDGSIKRVLDSIISSEHIFLGCYPDGLPQPVVSWWKDGVQINSANQTDTSVCRYSFRNESQQLYIDNLDEDCSGLYQCWATNKIGAIEAHQNIIIKKTESLEPTGTEPPASEEIISQDAIIIGFVILILATFCLGSIIFLWKERRRATRKLKQMGLEDFFEGALNFLKPGLTDAESAQFQPYERKWEFPIENLDMKGELGSGSFGVVEIARAKDLFGKGTNWLVAIKKPNEKQDKYVSIRALARELKTMMHLGKHLNVVNLLGACTKEIKNFELLVIIEYCAFGNLSNYLKNNGSEFISQIDGDTRSCETSHKISNTVDSSEKSPMSDVVDGGKEHFSNAVTDTAKAKCDCELGTDDTPSYYSGPPNQRKFADEEFLPLRTSTLLSWAFQVSNGMEYLRQRKVIHGDLAARNILLAKRNIVKITDFGLSKELHECNEYKKTTDGPLPFKWMAIETLRDGISSTKSDIWSFGIVLWEFFELGEQPYLNIQKSELLEKLGNGYRMGKPKHSTEKLYDLMMQCWNEKPNNRPSFINLVDVIGSLMDQEEKMYLEKLAFSYQNENKIPSEGGKDDESPDGYCASIVESFFRLVSCFRLEPKTSH